MRRTASPTVATVQLPSDPALVGDRIRLRGIWIEPRDGGVRDLVYLPSRRCSDLEGRRRQLVTELARPQVDAEALERIRADGVTMVDSASKKLVGAVVDASEVLTSEQREELARMVGRHRH